MAQQADELNSTFCVIKFNSTYIVIYLDFHSAKQALWLVDSCSCAPDQIQKYPDRDKIA